MIGVLCIYSGRVNLTTYLKHFITSLSKEMDNLK